MTQRISFNAPRGVSDILPSEQPLWDHVRETARKTALQFGYSRIDTPIFESTALFKRGVGDDTDIVQKEMYSFKDLGGDYLTLRPEGTAPVCRAYIQHGMHNLPQPVRLFYIAPMFRYDRPQAGRYRQHHQFGCEAIGDPSPFLDAEIIEIGWHYITSLRLAGVSVRINSVGDAETRDAYIVKLRDHFSRYESDLTAVDRDRLVRSPLRLLDSKDSAARRISSDAPRVIDFLSGAAAEHWDKLLEILEALGAVYTDFKYRIDHTLVRGLDYYNRTVFEFEPSNTGSQTSLFGGGRYDPLIGTLGGKPAPGIGFGSGIERIILEIRRQKKVKVKAGAADAAIIHIGEAATLRSVQLAAELRARRLSVIAAPAGRSMRAQMRFSNQSEARFAIIIGDREIEKGIAAVKPLLSDGEQINIALNPDAIANAVSQR